MVGKSSSTLTASEAEALMEDAGSIVFTDHHNRGDRIRVLHRIGAYHARQFTVGPYLPVHKAIRIFNNSEHYAGMTIDDVVTLVKYVKVNTPEYRYLIEAARRNLTKAPKNPNLIQILEPFYDNGHYVVPFPFMRGGSIRHILTTKFPNGLPEEWILMILNPVLSALSALHRKTLVHREVNACNIFLSGEPSIKLAYAATIYTLDVPETPSLDYLPASTIAYWAKAPQVYNNCREEYFVPSQDIWMVGITALELACGKLWVKDREALEYEIKEINRRQELPKEEPMWRPKMKLRRIFDLKNGEFSKSFERFVVKCLSWEIEERPTADELLQWPLFRGMVPMWSTIKAADYAPAPAPVQN